MEIRITDSYTAADKLLLSGDEADPSGTNIYGLEWRPKEQHVLVVENGISVSHVGLVKHIVRVGEAMVPVAGFGGVLTHPKHRGAGFARAAMDEAARWAARELDTAFGMLFCREAVQPWYEGLGWSLVHDAVWIDQPQGTIVSPFPVMVKGFGEASWPAGVVRLGSLPW
jgi:GNAT superfamily N-acetyltransferase